MPMVVCKMFHLTSCTVRWDPRYAVTTDMSQFFIRLVFMFISCKCDWGDVGEMTGFTLTQFTHLIQAINMCKWASNVIIPIWVSSNCRHLGMECLNWITPSLALFIAISISCQLLATFQTLDCIFAGKGRSFLYWSIVWWSAISTL